MRPTSAHGLWEPVTRRFFDANQVEWNSENLRESGVTAGINSRVRGTLYALHACLGHLDPYQTKIYAAEALTDFAFLMRGRFAKFLGSEYTPNPAVAEALFPIPNEDLTALSLKDCSFHAVVTNEVLEHVPFLDTAVAETARVLMPGGWHVGTCPFLYMCQGSQVRTKLEGGELVHVLPPEWHGDPMGIGGSLVFEIPGWDILDRARKAGFSRAFWKYVQSPTFGIAANGAGDVLVLCLQK
jgi:SAM-dependent methyltransferase